MLTPVTPSGLRDQGCPLIRQGGILPDDHTYDRSLWYHGPMAHDITPEEQYEQVYQGIREIAVRCDGARSLDMKGFNGVDTKFGRRIASVPFAQWTPEVCLEAAHIVLKYREQVMRWTDGRIDVGTLQVVRDAQDNGTNYKGRNDALLYEKRAAVLADRRVDVVAHPVTRKPCLGIFYSKKDPEFSIFLGACQALPGRKFDWDRKCNAVYVSDEAAAFIQEWDFAVSDAARALLEQPRVAHIDYQITLGTDGKVYIKTGLTAPGQPAADAVKMLPGRGFDRASYSNYANPHPQVLTFAQTYKLNVSPEATKACEAAQAALEARDTVGLDETDIATIMGDVSRCGSPADLPPVFVAMFKEMMAR